MKSRDILAGVLLTGSTLTACTNSGPASPELPGPDVSYGNPSFGSPPPPVFSQEPAFNPATGARTRQLLANDAPIRLIFVPVANRLVAVDQSPESKKSSDLGRTALLQSTLGYRQQLAHEFTAATAGRYRPHSVSMVKTGAISLKGCLEDANQAAIDQIRTAAKPLRSDNALNILVADQVGCGSELQGYVAGMTVQYQDPILTSGAYTDIFRTIIHETGHSGGLNHIGSLVCDHIVQVTGCRFTESGDNSSIMNSFLGGGNAHFTNPELLMLGLLRRQEILQDPKPGTYQLVDNQASGYKALTLTSPNGPVYFSLERDPSIAYDSACLDSAETPPPDAKISRKYTEVICYDFNYRALTHTLQTRIMSNGELNIITRLPDTDANVTHDILGEYRPKTPIYQDATERVVFDGYNTLNKATITVSRV